MRRSQRYRLHQLIASHLLREAPDGIDGLAEVDLYLQAFGLKARHGWTEFGATRESYIIGTLAAEADEEAILEMADDLGIDTSGPVVTAPPKIWEATASYRLFISHISEHKDKATRLRDSLAAHHISGFVAHEDIHPTALWEVEIQRALRSMDAFLAIHTKGFAQSVWTQQEIGFAVARGAKIVSFKMGEDPTGFISKHQALPRLNRTAEEIAIEVEQILRTDPLTKERYSEVVLNKKNRLDDEPPF